MERITADMTISQVLELRPDAHKILMRHGMHCIGCAIAVSESIGAAAEVHQVDLEKLLQELNEGR